jgi:hypothetical protein
MPNPTERGGGRTGPISKWKTDRLGMGPKPPRLKSGVPAGGYIKKTRLRLGNFVNSGGKRLLQQNRPVTCVGPHRLVMN